MGRDRGIDATIGANLCERDAAAARRFLCQPDWSTGVAPRRHHRLSDARSVRSFMRGSLVI